MDETTTPTQASSEWHRPARSPAERAAQVQRVSDKLAVRAVKLTNLKKSDARRQGDGEGDASYAKTKFELPTKNGTHRKLIVNHREHDDGRRHTILALDRVEHDTSGARTGYGDTMLTSTDNVRLSPRAEILRTGFDGEYKEISQTEVTATGPLAADKALPNVDTKGKDTILGGMSGHYREGDDSQRVPLSTGNAVSVSAKALGELRGAVADVEMGRRSAQQQELDAKVRAHLNQ